MPPPPHLYDRRCNCGPCNIEFARREYVALTRIHTPMCQVCGLHHHETAPHMFETNESWSRRLAAYHRRRARTSMRLLVMSVLIVAAMVKCTADKIDVAPRNVSRQQPDCARHPAYYVDGVGFDCDAGRAHLDGRTPVEVSP
jgi:transcription elongation factor Elf1